MPFASLPTPGSASDETEYRNSKPTKFAEALTRLCCRRMQNEAAGKCEAAFAALATGIR